ncbi:MAG: hypothetical protein WCD37_04115 [Chloroflexia bacterium]
MPETALLPRLAVAAEQDGWRAAALALLSDWPDLLQYVSDERSGDWRFLLPRLPKGRALCAGGALSPVPFALARTCEAVEVVCSDAEGRFLMARARQEGYLNVTPVSPDAVRGGSYHVVAALRSPFKIGNWQSSGLTRLAEAVRAAGFLYLEVDRPALFTLPRSIRARLRPLGFSPVKCWWPKPTFRHCEMLLPLGDRRLQRYYLDYQFFAMSPQRRVLRAALKLAVALDLFHLTLPEYIVLAQRSERGLL